ncbi:hypothetical protein J7302_26210, partial [Pseudomonas sp. DB1]|nr:hypothetical protein [Pseudomonas boanensis]
LYRDSKWDALDDVLGHTTSAPILNWMAEKERIRKLAWWAEVADRGILPGDGKVYHVHPVGLPGAFAPITEPLKDLIRKIGDIISHGEGNYDSYNTGTKNVPGGGVGFSFLSPSPGTVTNKTINEIISTEILPGTDKSRMFATGKYQTIISTLKSAKKALALTGEEKYTPDLQEFIFSDYLLEKAGGGYLARFVKHGKGSIDDAQYAAAKEWASIAAPCNYLIKDGRSSDGTLSYYESRANRANIDSTRALIKTLEATRRTK